MEQTTTMNERERVSAGLLWGHSERWWLVCIIALGVLARLVAAVLLGDVVVPLPAAWDQIYFHDVALNLLAGKGFAYSRPPWPFIQPLAPTAYTSFVYQIAIAAIYLVLGPHPIAARLIQALICSLLPWLVYGIVKRIGGEARGEEESVLRLRPQPFDEGSGQRAPLRTRIVPRESRTAIMALAAAGITAFYAYFIYFSATLMTDGPYLVTVAWSILLTLDLAEQPSGRQWVLWGLAVGLSTVLRQVYMPIAGLLFLYIVWKARRRVNLLHVAAAAAIVAGLILPWTVRNYLVFHRFLLLNSQAGQVLWNANHPDLGTEFESAMFPIPDDLQGADEVTINDELMRRGLLEIAAEPGRFLLLSLSRLQMFFLFYPRPESSVFSNIARTFSFGISLPFMVAGLAISFREWRRWLLVYLFIAAYIFIHIISWAQIRYRMPVDMALIPFAALALVTLAGWLRPALEKRLGWTRA